MLDLLVTMFLTVLVVLLGCVLAVALTALPFVVAVDLVERRRFSTVRWGALQLALTALAVVVGLIALRHTWLLALPVPLLVWTPALVLSLLSPEDRAVGGYQGAHEA